MLAYPCAIASITSAFAHPRIRHSERGPCLSFRTLPGRAIGWIAHQVTQITTLWQPASVRTPKKPRTLVPIPSHISSNLVQCTSLAVLGKRGQASAQCALLDKKAACCCHTCRCLLCCCARFNGTWYMQGMCGCHRASSRTKSAGPWLSSCLHSSLTACSRMLLDRYKPATTDACQIPCM
jgi:hypothetical protein